MKIQIQKACIIVFALFFFWSCRKSHDNRFDDVIQVKLSTEGLEYVQLTAGKYFIYKDSASTELDSVIVTKSILENRYTPGFNGGLFASSPAFFSEVFSLTLTKIDGAIERIWFKEESSFPSYSYSSMDNQPVIMHDLYTTSFCYPVSSCGISTAIESFTVEGKVYDSVIRTTGDNGAEVSSLDYVSVTSYWAKGVG